MRTRLTLAITKLALTLSQKLGLGGGAALPGLIAERIDPGLGRRLAAQLPKGVILVTGTNGKTTTTKLIAAMLEAGGERVLSNRTGSNLKRGVLSALISNVDMEGRTNATVALFEVDEAWMRHVAPELQPRHIVVTNLFRDQLDRYGELDTTAAMIGQGIAGTQAQVYLNTDDPLVASLAKYADDDRVHYFGVEELAKDQPAGLVTATDSDRCPQCGARLSFARTFYGHLGHYDCPTGDFERPKAGVSVTGVQRAGLNGTEFSANVNGQRRSLSLPLPGTYNLYNALGAVALADGLNIDLEVIKSTLSLATAAFGRVETVQLEGRTLYLLLIKNPAGFTQVVETFLLNQKRPQVLMVINDNIADGRDVSWLWDVPLEALEATGATVWSAGVRATDMALRLHYAGLQSAVQPSLDEAIDQLVRYTPQGGTAFILPTYTAMLQVRAALAKRTTVAEVNQ